MADLPVITCTVVTALHSQQQSQCANKLVSILLGGERILAHGYWVLYAKKLKSSLMSAMYVCLEKKILYMAKYTP